MSDIATTLHTELMRVVDKTVDAIAIDGVTVLRKILDEVFRNSEKLKDYEVYSHVSGRDITFEILIPQEAFDMTDAKTADAVEQARQEAQDEEDRTPGVRTYGFSPTSRAGRLVGRRDARRDARSSYHDARRDARRPPKTLTSRAKTAQSRLIEHQIALHSPRSMKVNREGMLSLRMTREVEEKPDGSVQMPKGKFQGVIGKFMDNLQKVIAENFAPELAKLLTRRLK